MNIAIIVFPGTNREVDMRDAMASFDNTNIRYIWHKDTDLGNPDLIVLPGGFSYGDYLRCGAMAAHSPIMREIKNRAEKGTPIFGVCNGFQMLVETQMLPGALLRNKTLKFICKRVNIRTESPAIPFLSHLKQHQVLNVPVAHGEGNYFAQDDLLKNLQDNDQIAFRYCNDNGDIDDASNPNGSQWNIAGITNKDKTILGMMPHPEDSVLSHQNIWQSPDNKDGTSLLHSILNTLN